MYKKEYDVSFEVRGPTAMWTRPDSGACAVTNVVPAYSQVVGMFSAILMLPSVVIRPVKVEICAPICFHNYSTNYGGPLRKADLIHDGNNYQLFATVLVDVCYRLYAKVSANEHKERLPKTALEWGKSTTSPAHAYQEIFNRRLQQGKTHYNVCLGWSEFIASYVGEFRKDTKVITEMPDIIIPSMHREVFSEGFGSSGPVYTYDQNLIVHQGTLFYSKRRGEFDQ